MILGNRPGAVVRPVLVYVAAASAELERVRAAYKLARRWGWKLTRDWTKPVATNRAKGITDESLPRVEAKVYALRNLDAIDEADLVWVLAPRKETKGARIELGYAMALRRHGLPGICTRKTRIVVSGCKADPAPELFLAAVPIVERDEDVRAWWINRNRSAA